MNCRIIDIHTHIYPVALARRAMEVTGHENDDFKKLPIRENLLARMREAGVDLSVNLPVVSKPQNQGEVNRFAKEAARKNIISFGGLHPDCENVIEELEKLKDMEKVNDIELGTQQKQQVRDGKPVELNVGGEKVSVGVDLREPQGFKVIKGDLKEWERQQKIRYDELHPEYLGLVQTDNNRWEYRKVVDRQSQERAMKLHSPKENITQSLKR